MEPLTSAWTERHTRVVVLVVAVTVAMTAAVLEEPPVTWWVAVAVVAAVVPSLVVDALGGAVAGFIVAALLIGVRRVAGSWGEDAFVLALVETAAIVAAGVAAGRVGVALRPTDDGPATTTTGPAVEPIFGSLGLLDADMGTLRLEEEVERAIDHGRPLTLAVLRIDVHDEALDAAGRTAAQRAVARLLESRVRDVDVPFALARDRLAVILPETDATAALVRVGAVLDGVSTGRFASRGEGTERALTDAVRLTVGTARLEGSTQTADALLDAAVVALARADAGLDADDWGR